MMLATIKGRIQTKLLTYIILIAVTLLFYMATDNAAYGDLFVVAMLTGLWLEALWGFLIMYQAGWLTFVLAAVEFVVIAAVAKRLGIDISLGEAAVYYLIAWISIQFFLLYIFPIFRLNWTEEGNELW